MIFIWQKILWRCSVCKGHFVPRTCSRRNWEEAHADQEKKERTSGVRSGWCFNLRAFAPFSVNHSALSCHLCIESLTRLLLLRCTVLFAVLLLQAVSFEAKGNKMKATSGAIIKVRTLIAWQSWWQRCQKKSICCAAVEDGICRLCSANLKMKGSLNFKQLWCQLQMRLIRERCTFKHSLQYVQLRIPATVHTPRIDARKY